MVYVMLKTKSYGVIVVLTLSAILGTGIVFAQPTNVDIRIAPATLNLDKAGACDDPWVTVHAEILLREVDVSDLESFTLTGSCVDTVSAIDTYADDRGYLVVKFDRAEVKGIVAAGVEDMTLTGVKIGGEEFTGTATIRVFER
jgi:hypothetical protein